MFNNSTDKFLLDLVKNKPRYVLASGILNLISAIFSAISIVLLVPILFILLNNQEIVYPRDVSYFVSWFMTTGNSINEHYSLIILIALPFLTSSLCTLSYYLSQIWSIKYNKELILKLKYKTFDLLSKVNLDYYRRHKIGDILFKINREIDRAVIAINSNQKILLTSTKFVVFSLVLVLISWRLTLMAIALVGLNFSINSWLSDRLKQQEILANKTSKVYNRQTVEFFTGIEHIKNAANELEEYQVITKSIAAKHKAELDAQGLSSAIASINETLKITTILVLSFSSYYLYEQRVQIFLPILLAYLLILFKLLPLISQLSNARRQFANNKFSVEVISRFLNEINQPPLKSGKTILKDFKQNIELHNVTFAYPNHAQIVLDKINLNIKQGNIVALVGSPGAGKSTLISLLSRINQPIEGNITIDGRDIAEYTLASLRKSIVVINKEPFLFNDSIFYNLTYGLANISKSEVIAATKKTKIYDFITQLPNGFDSKIGDGDLILVTQRQLIAITRALLSNPAIVILDESMKNIPKLDREIVQHGLNQLSRDRTTLVITNRLATIKQANQIIILNKGRIIEAGTHQELLKSGNLYKRMCSAQFKTSQQSHQQLLAKKISKKLSRQTNNTLSDDIRSNLNSLLNYLQLVNEGLVKDDLEQEKILDESYQSAKNMLSSLREYERKILRRLDHNS